MDKYRAASRYRELTGLFLRLGTTAFSSPAAHITMVHDEGVKPRKWLGGGAFRIGSGLPT